LSDENSKSDGRDRRSAASSGGSSGGSKGDQTIKIVVGTDGEIEAQVVRKAPPVVESEPTPVVADTEPEVAVRESQSAQSEKPSDSVSISNLKKGNLGQAFSKRPGRSVWLTGNRIPAFQGEELGFPGSVGKDKHASTSDFTEAAPAIDTENSAAEMFSGGSGLFWSVKFPQEPAPSVVESDAPEDAAPAADIKPEAQGSESKPTTPSAGSIKNVQKGNLGQAFSKRAGRNVWLTGGMPVLDDELLGLLWAPKEKDIYAIVDPASSKVDSTARSAPPPADDATIPLLPLQDPLNESKAPAQYSQTAEALTKAKIEFECGQFETALAHYEEALGLLEAMPQPDAEQICQCLADLIDVYMFLGRPEDALAASRRLHDVDGDRKKDKNYIIVLMKTAAACERSGNWAVAQEAYLEAKTLATALLDADDPLHARLNRVFDEVHKKQVTPSAPEKKDEAPNVVAAPRRQPTANRLENPARLEKSASAPPSRPDAATNHSRNVAQAAGRPFNLQRLPLLHAPWILVALSVLFLFCLAKLSTTLPFERNNVPAQPPVLKGTHFESCDKENTINFSSEDQCEIYQSGSLTNAKYTLLAGDRLDLATLFAGYLRRSEVWYQYDAAGRLVAPDKNVLYSPISPEWAIVTKMWWYANFANQYYKEGRLYPADAEKCKRSDVNFGYRNQVTGKEDSAAIILQKQNTKIDLITRGSNERHWRPGAIFCLCSDYKKFLIQGFDHNGSPLTSCDPARYFVVDCENGINLTEADQRKKQEQPHPAGSETSTRVLLYQGGDLEGNVQWIRRIFQLLLWTGLCLSCFWCYASHRSKHRGKARFGSIIAIILALLSLTAWYAMALQS